MIGSRLTSSNWNGMFVLTVVFAGVFSLGALSEAKTTPKKGSAPVKEAETSKPPETPVATPAVENKTPVENDAITTSPTEEPVVKAVKKRGSAASGTNKSEEGPESLFADEKGFLAGLDYPELQVVPRASERLQIEAQEERSAVIGSYWPVQISALTLMFAGYSAAGRYKETNPTTADKGENKFSSQMGMLVGGMLLGGTIYLDHSMVYGHALGEIKKNTGKDKKSALLRERLAEEALERPAKIANMISNISVWSTLLLAVYIEGHSEQGMPNYAGVAIAASMLPWLIENRLVRNWEKHQEYKRKIYAPITTLDFTIDPKTNQPMPLLGMQWQF